MRRETFLFTRSLVDENQSILFFLRANYSYVNRPLAKLYGVADQIKIDSAGILPSGESFQDLAGLKAILAQRHTFFARMLTEKLLAYACGRRIEPLDRAAVQEIFQPLEETGYPMRSLIERIVTSNLFRSK